MNSNNYLVPAIARAPSANVLVAGAGAARARAAAARAVTTAVASLNSGVCLQVGADAHSGSLAVGGEQRKRNDNENEVHFARLK